MVMILVMDLVLASFIVAELKIVFVVIMIYLMELALSNAMQNVIVTMIV